MSTPQPESSPERRANARRPCHHACLVRFDRRHLDGQPGKVATEGALVDLSPSGVGLLLRSAVPPGATLDVGPLGTERPPLPRACVVHCIPTDGRWRYGCGLERRLDDEELGAWLV